MASRNKGHSGRKADARPVVQHDVARLIEKGRYKDAIHEAKLCYRKEGTPENHRLLERAYLLRARQLHQGGMSSASQEVAGHLLEFGITDPALTEPASALFMALGMAGPALELQARIDAPDVRDRLTRQAADLAVIHPDRAAASMPEVREGAARVREALKALTAGDDATALDRLRDVSRHSPFSDWKLFARGLRAFRRKEADDARASWDRLDPARPASRIALALQAIGGNGEVAGAPNLEPLERLAFGEPVLGPLKELAALVAADRWPEAVRALVPLRFALRKLDPKLAVRLTQTLYSPLIRAAGGMSLREGQSLIKGFTRAAEPLPIDPNWNRLRAMVWEGPQGHIDEAEPFWRKYLDDLMTAPAVRPEERDRAQALVWLHLGGELVYLADELDPGGPRGRRTDPEVAAARRRAVEAFEQSLRLFPEHKEAFDALRDAYADWDEPEKAAAVNRRLLQAYPDDFDALADLADYHFRRDEPAEALDHARRARALRPLDPKALSTEWACHTALARRHALDARWDEGRAEFEAAARLDPELSRGLHFLARKAVFELKAGRPDQAQAFVADAVERAAEPTPVWLALLVEAERFRLPAADRDRYEAHWLAALPKKVRGETAGAMAGLLGSFLGTEITYPGRAAHVKQVVDYVGRTTRVKYAREDLRQVLAFLKLATRQDVLFEKLAKRGLKLFPDAPEFPLLLGSLEMEKGPHRGKLGLARKYCESALRLAQAREASDPQAAVMVAAAREALTALQDLTSGPLGLPFPPGGGGGGFFDALAAMIDEAGIDPDDIFGSEAGEGGDDPGDGDRPPARARKPGRKSKKG